VAILFYLTLDLSLPMMPGAFVFEAAQSVESVQRARGRAASEIVTAPPATAVPVRAPALEPADCRTPTSVVVPDVRPRVAFLPRATLDRTPATDDPY
jgi:hypothetical protein